MKISGNGNRATLMVSKKRCGIWITTGPWIEGINPELIKIRPKKRIFPAEMINALNVENNSDIMTDYFESDCVRLLPGHPLYAMAKAAA